MAAITYAARLSAPVKIIWSIKAWLASTFARSAEYRREVAYREFIGTLAHAARNDWRYGVKVQLANGASVEGSVELDDFLDSEHHQVGAVTLRSFGNGLTRGFHDYHYISVADIVCITLLRTRAHREDEVDD